MSVRLFQPTHTQTTTTWHDLATPHLASEYYIEHMDLPDELRDNITLEYYEAGHMMYVHEPSMVKFKEDLAKFVRGGQ